MPDQRTNEQRLAELERQLEELREANQRLAAVVAVAGPEPDGDGAGTSRRALLRLLAGAAAGGAVVAVAGASPAAAADPNDLALGLLSPTTARPTHGYYRGGDATGSAFLFQSSSTLNPPYDGTFGQSAALSGWASGGRHVNGVYGYSVNDQGAGVLGIAEEGGSYGVHAIGSQQAEGLRAEAEDTAIRAISTGPFGRAITAYGAGANGWGISAEGDETGVKAGSIAGYGIRVCGGRAMVLMTPDNKLPPPNRTDAHEAGEIDMDASFDLWLCTVSGTPGTWTKLNQAAPGLAAAFHAIEPVRVYDSRLGAYPSSGPMTPNTSRVVSVKDGRNASGTITTPDAVPTGATAVTFNVTVAGPTGPNYLSVVPGDAAGFTTSTINFPGGFDAANGSVVKLDTARQVKVFCGDQSGSTHVIIDITGYFA